MNVFNLGAIAINIEEQFEKSCVLIKGRIFEWGPKNIFILFSAIQSLLKYTPFIDVSLLRSFLNLQQKGNT